MLICFILKGALMKKFNLFFIILVTSSLLSSCMPGSKQKDLQDNFSSQHKQINYEKKTQKAISFFGKNGKNGKNGAPDKSGKPGETGEDDWFSGGAGGNEGTGGAGVTK